MFCAQCGAEVSAPGKFCAQCGSPVGAEKAADTQLALPSARPSRPGTWRLIFVPAALVVGLAIGFVVGVALPGREPAASERDVAAATSEAAAATTQAAETTSPMASATTSPTTLSSTSPTGAGDDILLQWPGPDGWTVIVDAEEGFAGAVEQAKSFAFSTGLSAGVVAVREFASLRQAGYPQDGWLVFSGVFGSKEEAQRHRELLLARWHPGQGGDEPSGELPVQFVGK